MRAAATAAAYAAAGVAPPEYKPGGAYSTRTTSSSTAAAAERERASAVRAAERSFAAERGVGTGTQSSTNRTAKDSGYAAEERSRFEMRHEPNQVLAQYCTNSVFEV